MCVTRGNRVRISEIVLKGMYVLVTPLVDARVWESKM
jgi:hypothetical protein